MRSRGERLHGSKSLASYLPPPLLFFTSPPTSPLNPNPSSLYRPQCLDGVHIYHKSGTLLGRIVFFPDPSSAFPERSRHCANLCLIPGGIVMMAEDRIYKATLAEGVKGALL